MTSAVTNFPQLAHTRFVFQTDSLEICKGVPANITPEAWPEVVSLIHHIAVVEVPAPTSNSPEDPSPISSDPPHFQTASQEATTDGPVPIPIPAPVRKPFPTPIPLADSSVERKESSREWQWNVSAPTDALRSSIASSHSRYSSTSASANTLLPIGVTSQASRMQSPVARSTEGKPRPTAHFEPEVGSKTKEPGFHDG